YFDEDMQQSNDAAARRLLMRGNFKKQVVRFDISSFQFSRSDEDVFRTNYTALNVVQLGNFIDSIRQDISQGRQKMAENQMMFFRSISAYAMDSTPVTLPDTAIRIQLDPRQQYNAATIALQQVREQQGNLEFFHMDQNNRKEQLWRYEIEWHRKFTLCAACLILFFIGAPLGSIIRKGGIGIPMTISILIFVFYWVTSTIGERMARIGSLSSTLGMWVSTLILLPVGIFVSYKSTKERQWVDFIQSDKIKKFFRNLFHKNNENPANL
ncbi:MAG: LptF/LptG family permease, partial [Bacteroidales bacterium]|nr:LptF/LptG family permease [Bacteroidales bacterium]